MLYIGIYLLIGLVLSGLLFRRFFWFLLLDDVKDRIRETKTEDLKDDEYLQLSLVVVFVFTIVVAIVNIVLWPMILIITVRHRRLK